MGIWGAAIGAGMKAAGSIYGGRVQRKAIGEIENSLATQQQENQDLFDRRYNEDATQRADAQRLLTLSEEAYRNRNRQAAGAAAVMGGTEEAIAAQKAAGNQALADTVSQLNAAAVAEKNAVEQRYLDTKDALTKQKNNMTLQKALATKEAVQGVSDAAGSIAGAF